MIIDYHQPFMLPPNRVWRAYTGGRILDELEANTISADTNFPEDWIGSATRAVNAGREHIEEGIGTARATDGTKHRMDTIFTNDPVLALGPEHVKTFGTCPQLLVKYLDSSVRLHMQAHPTAEWSQKYLNDNKGKTEVWWVLGSRQADPYVYFGFQHPPTPAEWGRMMKEQDTSAMQACFEKIPVQPGDILLIKGGIPHAIGEGLFVVEVQEPTDYVVKSEFSVAGITLTEKSATMGRGVEGVLDLFDYTAYPPQEIKKLFGPRPRVIASSDQGSETVLLERPQTDRVEVRQIDLDGSFSPLLDGRYSIFIVIEGAGAVTADGKTVDVARWSKLYMPACIEKLDFEGTMRIARCMPPTGVPN